MKNMTILAGALGLAVTTNGAASAGPEEDRIIDRAIEAYGGEAFTGMQNFVLREKFKRFPYGQSYDPSVVDISHSDALITVDFAGNRKDLRWFRGIKPNFGTQHQIFTGEKGFRLNHNKKTITENGSLRFANVDRRITYFLDTYLVRLLNDARETASEGGEIIFEGSPMDKLKFTAEGYPEMTLYFDKETGLLKQMRRPDWMPGQTHIYQYAGHREKEGIQYATETFVTRGGDPSYVTTNRTIDFNEEIDSTFTLPTGYGDAAPVIDFSEMTTKKITDGVYLAGQNWGFSLFVDAGDHYVAVGGYDRLKERLAAVQKLAGNEKPLGYQIVTHHHMDHTGGMGEAADLGATFIAVKEHVSTVRKMAATDLPDDRFQLVEGSADIAGGLVKVVDFPNGHASHNLLTYVPAAKMVFTADLFLSRQTSGAPDGYEGLKRFKAALADAGFDAQNFAAAHSGRILTAADLDAAINNIPEEVCPDGWPQCAE